jgi:NhaC family Na+:H+ antiporter
MLTTIPSFIITIIIFLIIGFNFETDISSQQINQATEVIANKFTVSLWLFLVPIFVIVMIIKKISAIPALLFGTILGAIFAIIFQPSIVIEISGMSSASITSYYIGIVNSMIGDVNFNSVNTTINDIFNIAIADRSDLLKSGGMYGMLNTLLLIFSAMVFSGSIEATGLLNRVAYPIVKYAKSTGSLIASTATTCIFFNLTTSDQYMSIVVPGRMYSKTYEEKELAAENLSRTLEDSGTVTSVLIPWNSCGATQSAVLGVATLTYLPFCFFNLISPLMTIAYGYFGIKIKKLRK